MELDPNHDGRITQEEFILIMSYIEQKQTNLPSVKNTMESAKSHLPKVQGDETSRSGMKNMQSTISGDLSIYEMDKKKYGALLPKSGVYFLPDERIVAFLK